MTTFWRSSRATPHLRSAPNAPRRCAGPYLGSRPRRLPRRSPPRSEPDKVNVIAPVVPEREDEDRLILDSVNRFLERHVRPVAMRLEHDDEYPAEIVEQMKALGLFGAVIPAEYGGLGLRPSTYVKIIERIATVWMSISGIINSHLIMARIVELKGTEAQKREFLPRFATGEVRGGLALTEPDAGTDLQAIRTTARRDGDHYVVNGTKTWI